jgi:hypothetical protein
MPVQRIGPAFGSLSPSTDPDATLTRQVEAALKAFAQGGTIVHQTAWIFEGARKDYERGPASELAGIKSISFLGAQDVADRGIVRHGGKVSRVLYCRISTDSAPLRLLAYLTAEGLLTDQDVVRE